MTNGEIARVFGHLAVMLELEGANVFRVRAYKEAARVVNESGESIATLAPTPGALEALPGIGKDLAQKIRDLVTTGTTPMYRDLQQKFPITVVELTELQGLGPKRVATLFEVLGVRNRDDLEKAAKEGRLRDLPGFGEKVEQNVLKAIAAVSQWSGRITLASAWPLAHALAEQVRKVAGVTQVELAGSFRRRKETVGDLDVLVTGGHTDAVMEAFVRHSSVAEILGRGDTKSSVRLAMGLQVDLRHVPESSFGAALLYFTGSKEHNIELRRIAIEKGLSLNEYGLTRGEKVVASRTEEEIYRALGAEWIPPELREAHGEIEVARFGRLPRLVELGDLRADLHMHTTRTDGRDSIATMVQAVIDRGYQYMAITEHSKALPMTFGFDAARVRQSVGEIEEARRQFPDFPILHGLEVDILGDGELDLDDETLALLDWVIVSIHSRFEMTPEAATARVVRALENPWVHLFGHPTGRMIGSRNSIPFDFERVAELAAARNVLMEINAGPDRLDLNEVHARLAKSKGCGFAINTDAHSTLNLDHMRYGVFQARRAGLTRDDVWNARDWASFSEWLAEKRPGARPVAAGAPGVAEVPEEAMAVAAPGADTESAPIAEAPARRTAKPKIDAPAKALKAGRPKAAAKAKTKAKLKVAAKAKAAAKPKAATKPRAAKQSPLETQPATKKASKQR